MYRINASVDIQTGYAVKQTGRNVKKITRIKTVVLVNGTSAYIKWQKPATSLPWQHKKKLNYISSDGDTIFNNQADEIAHHSIHCYFLS